MRITDRLKAEHGVFLRQLKTLERMTGEGAPAPALAAAVRTIAEAEAHHSELEDRVLYPALARVVGAAHPGLRAVADEHARLRGMSDAILAGGADAAAVVAYARLAREHFEHEIHGAFVTADEWIDAADLEGMANWNVDHTFEETGRPAPWEKA